MPTENRSSTINASRALLERLQLIASRQLGHINAGSCPDHVEGHEKRDGDCTACNALGELESLLNQPPEQQQCEPLTTIAPPEPYGYLREVDSRCQLSVGPARPADRASGYATPWGAIYSTATVEMLMNEVNRLRAELAD